MTLAGYHVQDLIERGGMGAVYRGEGPQGPVAIKVLNAGRVSPRFLREVQAMQELQHPRIVRLLDTGTDSDGQPFLVMEFVAGRSLHERLREGPLSLHQALAVGLDLCDALACVHAHGVLHRDLKPGNVLLDQAGRVKLTDFGLAKIEDQQQRLTRTGAALGTPAFMPPEQATGDKARIGPASDIYGLGATLYASLAGEPPFSGPDDLALLVQVVTGNHKPLARDGLPRELVALVERCLAKDPAERPQSADEVAEALRRIQAGDTPARGAKRRLPVALGLLLVGAAGLGWALRPASSTPSSPPQRLGEGQALARHVLEVYEQRLRMTLSAGEIEAALVDSIQLSATLCEARPDDGHAWAAHGISSLLQDHAPRTVLADLERAVELEPAVPAYWAFLGWRRATRDDPPSPEQVARALDEARRGVALDPDDPISLRTLARLLDGRDSEQALQHIDHLLALETDWPDCYLLRAGLRYARGDHALTVEDCDRALELAPRYSEALHLRALAHLALRATQQARDDVRRARELGLRSASLVRIEARSHQEVGEHRESQDALRRGVEAFPDDPSLRLEYAQALRTGAQLQAALAELERAAELAQGTLLLHVHRERALALANLGQDGRAREALAAAWALPEAELEPARSQLLDLGERLGASLPERR